MPQRCNRATDLAHRDDVGGPTLLKRLGAALQPRVLSSAEPRRSWTCTRATARTVAGPETVVVVVVAVFIGVVPAPVVFIVGRQRRVPILVLHHTESYQVSQRRDLSVDELLRPQEQRQPAIMLLRPF